MENPTTETGIRTHTGELFPYGTARDFLKSEDFMNIIIQCGQREAQMVQAVEKAPADAYWQERLADARKATALAIQARTLAIVGKL